MAEIEFSTDVIGMSVKYLDAMLFQEAIEYALKDCIPVKVEKISIGMGSSTGDNFLGVIYRVKVNFRRMEARARLEELSFIVKCTPYSEANEFLKDANVFLKEMVCYRDILPRMEVLSHDGSLKFGAKLYHSVKEPINTLIFEDLNTRHYKMASRESGLDEEHCNVVLKRLGKFHAMSMLLAKKDPSAMHCFHSGLVSQIALKDSGLPMQHYGAEIAILETVVRTWPGYQKIADKIKKYRLNLRDNLLNSIKPSTCDIPVLNHGDLWVNNVLFKYQMGDSKPPTDVVFVDFQMSLWGSLGFDLNYFFNTSVQLSVLQERRMQLLRVYYDSLNETLRQMSFLEAIPSFEDVVQEVQRREAWGFFAAFAIFPMVALDKTDASDNNLDNLADPDFARRKIEQMYAVERVAETLKYSLKRFDKLGIFD